ncbi:MAG: YitT family protein [Bacteroidia bacterium]|nr:YitT family protein [Bacteroidia bacterium]
MKVSLKSHGQDKTRIRKLVRAHTIKEVLLIWAGIGSATLGLKGFLLPNGFMDGGVTGISLLVSRLTGLDLSILIILINLPFIYIGSKQISRQFAVKTLCAVIGLSFLVHFVELPEITHDKLLISVFGGFFLGAGIGLAIRGGSVIDGTEVLAVFVSRKSSLTVGDFIAVFNVLLFASAALLIDLETAMYSMLTYLAASKTVDFLINGIEEYMGITIISPRAEEIKTAIIENLGMAVTVYKGEGGYGKSGRVEEDRKIIFAVVTRLEVQKLKVEVEKVDPKAFVIQHTINDTKGGMIKKRPLH